AEGRLDEALSLAVGLGSIGTSEGVPDTVPSTGVAEAPGPEGGAVIGKHPFYRYPERGEVGNRGAQEGGGVVATLAAMNLGKAEARVIVNAHEQELPACSIGGVATVAGDAVAQALDTPEFLGVDVEQIARAGMLVAHDRFSWKQVRELGDASSLEY